MFKDLYDKVIAFFILGIGKIHWKASNTLTEAQQDQIRSLLIPQYYIILTHRNNHLSTFFVGLANFMLTGKWGYWAHALMNLEDEAKDDKDFRLVEAVGTGVAFSSFAEVFDVHGAVLLRPKNMSADQWTAVMDKAKSEVGKPYDTLFDLKSDQALSCVELVRTALMAEPDYEKNFANFEALIKKRKNLSPQMFYECDDFEIAYEVRR